MVLFDNYLKKIRNKLDAYKFRIKYHLLNDHAKEKAFSDLFRLYGGVIIQNSGLCNARCVFCPYRFSENQKQLMPDIVFDRILSEYERLGGGSFGFLCVQGEPTLDPKLVERIKKVRQIPSSQKISMITNAIAIDKHGVDAVLNSGINAITISTSGFDKEMFFEIYGSNQYDRMYANVIELLTKNKESGNKVDISIAIRSSKRISNLSKSNDFKKVQQLTGKISFLQNYDNWNGQISKNDLKGVMKLRPVKKSKTFPCTMMLWSPIIFENGLVSNCGCRISQELIIGDIMKQSLDEIFFGEKRKENFEMFIKKTPPEFCKNCSGFVPAYETVNYILKKS